MTTEAAGGDEIRRFEEQYRRNPDSLVFARLADAYRKAGDPRRALEILEQGILRHRDYPSAQIIRARTFIDLQRPTDADEAFRHVLELDSQNLVAMRGLAELTEKRGDPAAAVDWYERIAALDPLNVEATEALERLRSDSERIEGHRERLEPTTEEWWSSPASGTSDDAPPDVGAGSGRLPDDVAGELEGIDDELGSTLAPPVAATVADEIALEFDDVDLPPPEFEVPVEPEARADHAIPDADAAAMPDEATKAHSAEAEVPEAAGTDSTGTAWWFEDPGEAESSDDGDLLTRTMADLYARQGLVEEAAAIYRELLVDRPTDEDLRRALLELEERFDEPPPPKEKAKQMVVDPPLDDPAPAAEAAPAASRDPYVSHDVPIVAARSEYFLAWIRRLAG